MIRGENGIAPSMAVGDEGEVWNLGSNDLRTWLPEDLQL